MMFQQLDGRGGASDSLWDSLPRGDQTGPRAGPGPSTSTPWLFGPGETQKKQANQLAADEGLFGERF